MYNGGESSGFPSIRSGEGELAATLSYRTIPIVFCTATDTSTATTPFVFLTTADTSTATIPIVFC